ncbi:MAG: DUF3800 domain-containing protein, partial [Chloroflexi bacterium]|nr:DUF3800 domain-containing protein [Chloroflexota bacterium]
IEVDYYRNEFQPGLESLKQQHFPHNPDDPVVLHREDIYNRRHAFGVLADPERNASWEEGFTGFVRDSRFVLFGVVIDKKRHKRRYGNSAQHPYHLCLTFLLERYKGFLNYHGCKGDVLAESRGKNEDALLCAVYSDVWSRGTFYNRAESFQSALTSKELKLRRKVANVAGLQLADLLAHPVKMDILSSKGKVTWPDCFGKQVAAEVGNKYNVYGRKLLG